MKNFLMVLVVFSLVGSCSWAAKKDCSHTKTMAELKQCDPAQYEETQRILNNVRAALEDSDRVQAEANQTLENHTNNLHQINQQLEQILQDAKNR